MRFKQIIETTTAGSVATVAKPMMTQTRENVNVPGLKPVQKLMKGTKKKGPYANSIAESKVTEDDLAEQDLIVIPGQGRLRRTGFVKHDLDQGEHEGHTLKNSLHTIARAASDLDERLSVQSEFPEWVSEKIGAAKGMMVTVMDYLISSQEMQHDRDAMNEGEVSTSNLRMMYDLARMTKNYCSPEGHESLNQLIKIIRWYMDQAEQGVTEDDSALQAFLSKGGNVQQLPYKKPRKADKTDYGSKHIGGGGDKMKASRTGTAANTQGSKVAGMGEAFDLGDLRKAAASSRSPEDELSLKRNPDFGKLMQKSVNNHNKAVVKTKQDIGSRIADIGTGGKEYNVKTDAAWDAAKKKVSEGSASKEKQKTPFVDRDSPESKEKIQAVRDKSAKDKAAEPGKKLADKIATNKKA